MRKTLFTTVGALLIAASTAQIASAAESRHAHKTHVTTYQQFRNANSAIPAPATSNELIEYSGGWYGPLGHSAM